MKSFLFLLALSTSALASVITIGPGVEKDGKKYYLQFPDCKTAFYAGDNFQVEALQLRLDWKTRYQQSQKYMSPVIVGFAMLKDKTQVLQTDLIPQIQELKRAEAKNDRKLYEKCTTRPTIKLLSQESSEIEMLKDEHGSVKMLTQPGKLYMTLELNPLVPEHEDFLRQLLKRQTPKLELKLSALQEIASCSLESRYELMSRFKDVVYYDQVCRDTKVCKKYWFVTECWKEYKCTHIPHRKRVFVDTLLEDETSLELTTRPGTEENIRSHLLDQCLDGFIVSNFMTTKTQNFEDGTKISMDTILKEHKDTYSFRTSIIEAYPNHLELPFEMNATAKAQLQRVYTEDRFDCFKTEDTIWLPEQHPCIKEMIK